MKVGRALGVLLAVGLCGVAVGDDDDRGDRGRGWKRDRDHGRHHSSWNDHGKSRTSISISIGSGWHSGWGSGWGGSHRSSYYGGHHSYYRPKPVYVAPCPPPVIVKPRPIVVERPVYVEPCPPPVVHRPVVVERPVYVERPVVVEKPVYVERPVVVEVARALPRAARAEELLSTSDRELGDNYLRLGDPQSAARVYSQHLRAIPGDAVAQRSLGLALLADRQPDEGFRAVIEAYRIDPGLASRPVRAEQFGDAFTFRRIVDDASRSAERADSPAGWLTVAALFQADGRAEAARNALGRAKSAGLEREISAAMEGVLP